MYVVFCILQCAVFHGRFMEKRYDTRRRVIYQSYIRAKPLTICIHNAVQVHMPRPLSSEYDTIRKTSLTWTQKLSDQLSLAHEARKKYEKEKAKKLCISLVNPSYNSNQQHKNNVVEAMKYSKHRGCGKK